MMVTQPTDYLVSWTNRQVYWQVVSNDYIVDIDHCFDGVHEFCFAVRALYVVQLLELYCVSKYTNGGDGGGYVDDACD